MVSTKNISGGPVRPAMLGPQLAGGSSNLTRNDRLTLFVVISVVVHLLIFLALSYFAKNPLNLLNATVKRERAPMVVEVVELPPEPSGKAKAPEKAHYLAQRSQSVEKEVFPERVMKPRAITAIPAIIIPPTPGKLNTDDGGRAGFDKAQKKEAAQKEKSTTIKEVKKSPTQKVDSGIKKSMTAKARVTPRSPHEAEAGAGESARGAAPMDNAASEGAVQARPGIRLTPSRGALVQIAREDSVPENPSAKEGKGMKLLLNTSDFKYQKYFMDVKRRIQFYWEYPPLAARKGQQGRLRIDFTIQRDGTIKADDIKILKSSNYAILDDAAETALRLAAPFNPFPEGFDIEKITVNGSFEYNLLRGR